MSDSQSISGSCSCGAISWTSEAAPQHLDFCYCLTCQKIGSAPFMAWMGIPNASLSWHSDGSSLFVYRSFIGDTDIVAAERKCCKNCGCNISLQYYLYPEKIHVAASTTDSNHLGPLKVGCHIWTKSVPEWYSIPEDGIPRYDEFDDEFQGKLDEWLQQTESKRKVVGKQSKGGWWAGMLPGDAPDYSTIDGPDSTTMGDIWNDPSRVKRPTQ